MQKQEKNSIKFYFTNSKFVPDDTSKGLFMFLIFQTLVSLAYQVLAILGFGMIGFIGDIFGIILSSGFIVCAYAVCKSRNLDFVENVKVKKAPTVKQVFICLGISLICIFGFSGVTNLFMEILYQMGYNSVASEIVIANFGTYIFSVITICVIPAVAEEVLFRGLICNGLKKLGMITAVLGSAFLFMIMHGSPDQTVHQFILGIILALAFLISNNLWVPILIHFFNNFIAVTFTYIAYGDSASSAVTETTEIMLGEYFIYAVISAIVSGIIVYFLLKLLSKAGKTSEEMPVTVKQSITGLNDSKIDYSRNVEISSEVQIAEVAEVKDEASNEYGNIDPVFITNPNKLTGTGRAMYVISVVWLAIEWVSALVLGFTSIY